MLHEGYDWLPFNFTVFARKLQFGDDHTGPFGLLLILQNGGQLYWREYSAENSLHAHFLSTLDSGIGLSGRVFPKLLAVHDRGSAWLAQVPIGGAGCCEVLFHRGVKVCA